MKNIDSFFTIISSLFVAVGIGVVTAKMGLNALMKFLEKNR